MINCIFVGMGGFLGAVLRYLIGLIPVKNGNIFPVKTFLINIAGAFVIGLIVSYAAKHHNSNPHIILLLKVGVCGGFTTFSTFALETADLVQKGNAVTAGLYVVLSVIFSVLAVFLAQMVMN